MIVKPGTVGVYTWGNNEKRATMKGRACRVLAVGRKRSCLIQFADNGQKEIVDQYAIRPRKRIRKRSDIAR